MDIRNFFTNLYETVIISNLPVRYQVKYYSRNWGNNINEDIKLLRNERHIMRRLKCLSDKELNTYIMELKKVIVQCKIKDHEDCKR